MSESDGRNRRPLYAVVAVMLLAVLALYVALGGPVPFLVDGSPALDSVPEEADAVVYADAWTFSSETSRGVADGLLAATNRSLPGYTGPASLEAAFEALQGTDLDPQGLRSVTAFGAYTDTGQPSAYQGLVLKTSWEEEAMLTAFGGNASRYAEDSYEGTAVFVHDNDSVQFPWVARLDGDTYVLGNESAVTDSVDARADRDPGIRATLRTGFTSLTHGPVRFAATMPEQIPGAAIAPPAVTDTIDDIETVGGVYYPDGEGATVELEVRTDDADTAARIEPVVGDAVAFARENAPTDTADLLDGGSIARSDTTVTVSLSGSSRAFVDGYQAFLESSVVRLLLGQAVGTPALELVPPGADTVAYGDAGIVADPTTFGLAGTLLGEADTGGLDVGAAIDRVRNVSSLDPTAFRSVTLFARNATSGGPADSAAIVEAGWSREAVERTYANSSLAYDSLTVAGTPVFTFEAQGTAVWHAVLGDGHHAIGSPDAVRAVLARANGETPALGGEVRAAFERLPRGYLSVVARAPASLGGGDGPVAGILSDLSVVGVSYDSSATDVTVRTDLAFATVDSATNARQTIDGLRRIAAIQISDERVGAFLDSIRFTQSGAVVTAQARTDPATVVAVAEWALNTTADDSGLPLAAVDGRVVPA